MRMIKTFVSLLGLAMVLSLSTEHIPHPAQAIAVPDGCGICVYYDTETGEQITHPYRDTDSDIVEYCPCDCGM